MSPEEKEIIHQANREHNVEREDYASPDEILNRKKAGFTVPVGEWINGSLKDLT